MINQSNISPSGKDFNAIEIAQISPVAKDFIYQKSNTSGKSKLGENYWLENILGQPVFMPVKLGGIQLPNPIITISGSKTIVETAIVGQEGTVKEIINTNDYEIKIRSYVKDESDVYPEDLVKEIAELYKQNKLLTIESVLTDFFIQPKDNCIITGINIPESEGLESMEIIEITLKSDREFEILID